MDNTARLRSQKAGIESIPQEVEAMTKKNLNVAEDKIANALKLLPNDYTALVMMAKIKLLQNKDSQAITFATQAKATYPQEAQAYYVSGVISSRDNSRILKKPNRQDPMKENCYVLQ